MQTPRPILVDCPRQARFTARRPLQRRHEDDHRQTLAYRRARAGGSHSRNATRLPLGLGRNRHHRNQRGLGESAVPFGVPNHPRSLMFFLFGLRCCPLAKRLGASNRILHDFALRLLALAKVRFQLWRYVDRRDDLGFAANCLAACPLSFAAVTHAFSFDLSSINRPRNSL